MVVCSVQTPVVAVVVVVVVQHHHHPEEAVEVPVRRAQELKVMEVVQDILAQAVAEAAY